MKTAAFPVIKTLDELDRSACSIPGPTLDYLASLEWITAGENLCLVGPAGTGKSHLLVALGAAAVAAGHKVRYHTAAELTETLYRGLAGNSVGKVIDTLLRNDLILIDLCRPRNYADSAGSSAGPGSWGRSVAGIVPRAMITGCRGTPGSCRWGGICPAGR